MEILIDNGHEKSISCKSSSGVEVHQRGDASLRSVWRIACE